MKKLLAILALCSQIPVYSQCLTDHYRKEAIKNNPALLETEKAFYQGVSQVDNNTKRATKYIIPVVFHVIHTNGPENISKAQIENQIKILNEDFSLNNPNKVAIRTVFKNIAADCEIEFRLAKIDPQGNCTDGINRVYSSQHMDARDNVKNLPLARWPNQKYLNIWTVSSIQESGSSGGTTLGYAYLPYSVNSPSSIDGIVIRADRVGVIGTGNVAGAGRTLTHEVGHYLGLLHTFDEACAGTGTGSGDYCGDTPPVSGTFVNANCPANGNSCSSDVPNMIDQWENYMDYSSGSCQSMFSLNQKSIMFNALSTISFRKTLVSTANLVATGVQEGNTAPQAFFYSSSRTVCVGQPVTFYDISCKSNVDTRNWTFLGSNIISTNKDTPVIMYSAPGQYKVTLKVTNGNGSNSLTVDNYITVKPAIAIDKPSVVQNFKNPNWNVSTGWNVLDQGTVKFTRSTTEGYKDSTSLYAPITASVPAGQRFQFTTPPMDLRSLKGKSPKISMMVAYIMQNSASSEELRFYYSRGCDNNWTQFLKKVSFQISYTNSYSPTFKPNSPSQWKQVGLGLSAFDNDSNISFMIEVVSGGGNPVYIDDFNIGEYFTDITPMEKSISLNVFPNPSTGELNIQYVNAGGETEVWLENIEGKKVATILENNGQTGPVSIKWNDGSMLPGGIYILKIKSDEQVINKKVIFAN